MEKSAAIKQLISKLSLKANGWEIQDYWDGDLCAVGIVKKGSDEKLVYINSFNQEVGKFYYELEVSTGQGVTNFEVIKKAEAVDFETLYEIMKSHLG